MIRLVYATDPHLSHKAPASRTDDWSETVLDKFSQVADICRENKADACLWGGDIFHIKSPDENPHRLVSRLAKVLRRFPCESWSCIGNHDCKWGNYQFLGDQPLETLFSSRTLHRLYDNHEALFRDDSGLSVRVVGVPYHGPRYDLDRFKNLRKGDENYLVCVAHVLASQSGGTMFEREDVIRYKDLVDLAPDVDLFAFGHWHKDQDIDIVEDRWIVNIGSMTRGSIHQDEIERIPQCAVIEFSKKAIFAKKVPLKVRPHKEVFDVEKKVAAEVRETTMSVFVDKLAAVLSESSGRDFGDVVSKLDVPDQVRERGLWYLERAKEAVGHE